MENKLKVFACVLCLTGCAFSHEDMSKGQELELRPVGLYTDPNPHGGAPKGALRVAQSVVLRRDGLLEPRPGFERSSASLTGTDPSMLIPFDGDLLIIEKNSGTEKTDWYNSGSPTNVKDDDSADLDWDMDHIGAAEARGNLYLATQDSVRKLTSSNDTAAAKAGAPRPYEWSLNTNTAGSVIDQYGARAYTAVIRRTDSNGVVVRSPVSPAAIVNSSAAASKRVDFTVYFDSDEVIGTSVAGTPGDTLEIYRTPQVVGSASAIGVPGEEYFLIEEHELTSAEAGSGFYTSFDNKSDDLAGAALYTNPSQEGILQNNDYRHIAKDLALFKNSLFSANVKGPHRLTFTAAKGWVDQTGNASGLGYRNIDEGVQTNGSSNITGIGATAISGVKVGMLITGAGIQEGTRVSSILNPDSWTIVMTKTATSGGTPAITLHDTVRIKIGALEDLYYPISGAAGWSSFVFSFQVGWDSFNVASDYVFARFLSRSVYNSGYDPTDEATLILEARQGETQAFEVFATHGSEYDPILPEPNAVNGFDSVSDVRPNAIQWSKADQPEHVPEANYAVIGSDNHEILKLVPTKDALFVFKTDGVWRLTGFGAQSGWRIDPIDTSTFLLTPRTAGVLSGQVFAWTNRGLVHVRQDGIDPQGGIISKLAIGNKLSSIERSLAKYSTETPAAFLAINEKDDELILGVPNAAGDVGTNTLYVYNTKTRAWVEWPITLTHAVNNPADNLLYGVAHWSDAVTIERSGGVVDTADREYAITINSVVGTKITIASGSGWTPGVGDCISQYSEDVGVITSVTSSTVFDVDMTGFSTGAAIGYDSFRSIIEFLAKTAGNPAARKHFQKVAVIWEDLKGVRQFDFEVSSSLDGASSVSETRSMTRSLSSTQPRSEYFIVPTDHAVVSQLFPRVEVLQGGAEWALAGLGVTYEVLSALVEHSQAPESLVASGGS